MMTFLNSMGDNNLTSSAFSDVTHSQTSHLPTTMTSSMPKGREWFMSQRWHTATVAMLSTEAVLALLSNALLIVTIRFSPSLRTPPNCQLISVCVNNLLLMVNAVLSLTSLELSPDSAALHTVDVLKSCQLFLTTTAWLQYWCIFSAISLYRCTTLKRPSMSAQTRKAIIYKSIRIGWLLSLTSGLVLALALRDSQTTVNWNPFRQRFLTTELDPLTSYQSLVLLLIIAAFLAGGGVLVSSYCRIFRMLCANRPPFQNRVYPLVRTASISSVENDLTEATHPSYRPTMTPTAVPSPTPFTISGSAFADNNFTVHFQRRQHSVTMEIFALENPIRAHGYATLSQRHRPRRPSVSNASNSVLPEFTDISPACEIQRLQKIKTNYALRKQSMRRERVSLGGATKNSLVMLLTYFLLSLPMLICCIPGLLPREDAAGVTTFILVSRLIFYINSAAYPLWYLIFSRRVRKCLHCLLKQAKAKLGCRS